MTGGPLLPRLAAPGGGPRGARPAAPAPKFDRDVVSAFVRIPAGPNGRRSAAPRLPPAPPEESLADLKASFLASR